MPNAISPGGTHILPVKPSSFAYSRFRVRVLEGPDEGREVLSVGAELAVGSDAGNQLVLNDPTVLRHHCVITATPDGFAIRDLGSSNGTLLAGCRIGSAILRPGTVVDVGLSKLRFDALEEEVREPISDADRFGRVLGRSAAMGRLFALLPRIAASDSTVLLEGETGTGKGLLAEAIHEASPRARGPFVPVDCGSIPPTLIESELFGYERGAFTGAHAARAGAFEAAQGGTIFLDEIGELPLEMQPKLLRVLEDKTIKRLGRPEPFRVDVRVVTATNRDLREAVNRGSFRSDLYYRLNIVRLRMPPLRERPDDVPLLVQHFYEQLAGEGSRAPAELLAALEQHDWPGNARELRGAIERTVLMGDPTTWSQIAFGDGVPESTPSAGVPDRFDAAIPFRVAKERAVARWERWYVRELMRRADGNLSRAARMGRMDRGYLRELARRYGFGSAGDE